MNSFLQILAQSPHDWTTRLVYADWLEEHERGREAFLQRWMGTCQKFPEQRSGPLIRKIWAWHPLMGPRHQKLVQYLPLPVFFALKGTKITHRRKLYLTLDEALEDLSHSLDTLRSLLSVIP